MTALPGHADAALPAPLEKRLKSRDARETLLIARALLARELGESLLALWAHGSLVLGDLSEAESDLDLVGVLAPGIAAREAAERAARAFGDARRIAPWGARLDARFVRDGEIDLPGAAPVAIVRHGRPLRARARPRGLPPVPAADRAVLASRGVALLGPDPGSTVVPPDRDELDAEMAFNLAVYWAGRRRRPWLFASDLVCAFAATTLPRIVATIETGRIPSKASALDRLHGWAGFEPLARWARSRRTGRPSAPGAGGAGRLHRSLMAWRLVPHARDRGLAILERRRGGESVLDR